MSFKRNLARWLCCLAVLLLNVGVAAYAQMPGTLPQGTAYLKARFAYYAPDGSHLLVTLCEVQEGRCRPWRYHLAQQRWERVEITPFDPLWSIDSATYSPDGKTMAVSVVKCLGNWRNLQCPLLDYRLALIDAATGALRILVSPQARFMPGFTPDGQSLVYWGLDNATPSRSGQAVYASHNLYMVGLAGAEFRKVFEVIAQRPFAPPKVLTDGKTVTIAAKDVLGAMSYQGVKLKNGMRDESPLHDGSDDSVILGDLETGEMQTLLRKGAPAKVLFDISADGKWALYSERHYSLKQFLLQDPSQQQVLKPAPKLSAKKIMHASYSPSDGGFVYVDGYDVNLGSVSNSGNVETLIRPTWQSN